MILYGNSLPIWRSHWGLRNIWRFADNIFKCIVFFLISLRYWSLLLRVELIIVCITLTHWGRVTHICVSKLTIIGSDNGLSPCRRQVIIWTNAGILLIRTLGTNFGEILGEIHSFSLSEMLLKMSSTKWRLFGLGLNELSNGFHQTSDNPWLEPKKTHPMHWYIYVPDHNLAHWGLGPHFINII